MPRSTSSPSWRAGPRCVRSSNRTKAHSRTITGVLRGADPFHAPILAERLEQALDVTSLQGGAGAARGVVNSGRERLFALLQFEHALLDRALRDELVDEDGLVLADA